MPPSVLRGRVDDPLTWTQEDTDLAVALAEIEAERCSGCGHPVTDTMDPDLEFEWEAEALRCHSCAARDRAAEKAGDMGAGVRWLTTRRRRGD